MKRSEMWCGEYGNKMNMFTFMSFNYIICVQFPLLDIKAIAIMKVSMTISQLNRLKLHTNWIS